MVAQGRRLNAALVGYGYVGRVFHAPLLAHTDGIHLHTVVSSDAGKVHAELPSVRVVADPRQAFADDDIDFVVIATPNATHAALAMAALRAGRHVVVDKPFTTTLAEARQVAAVATETRRIASVFQNRRWDGDFLTLRQLVDTGALGEIVELHSRFDRYRPQVPDRWRERAEPGSGLWFDLGPHLLDQALQLFGTPQSIQADVGLQRDGAVVDDFFQATLHYGRLRVVLHASVLTSTANARFTVHGTLGSASMRGEDVQESQLKAGMAPGAPGWGVPLLPAVVSRIDDGERRDTAIDGLAGDYRHYYAAMRDAILGDGPPPVSLEQALEVMSLLELGATSAHEGRTVRA